MNGQLYAIDNGTGKFWILDAAKDGNMTFAKGFENGKRIIFPKDENNSKAKGPDSEGITVDGNGYVYAACERDNSEKGLNYNTILKVDPRQEGTDLTAMQLWDLTASLPQVSANMGIEAVEWVSNDCVDGKLYDQNTNAVFDFSKYPDAVADGVFFVALEDNGHVYAYVLNEDGSVVQIADIDSKLGGAMALDYDTYENVLWIVADNGYENRAAKAVFNGKQEVEITLVKAPAGLDTSLNNEGFAIADATYTVYGQRPVYRFQDGVAKGALSVGHIACSFNNSTEENKPVAPVVPSKPGTSPSTGETSGSTTSGTDSSTGDTIGSSTSGTDSSAGGTTSSTTSAKVTSVVIQEQNVPMAESVNEALSILEVVAAGKDTNLKLDLVSKYFGKNLGLMVHLGNGVGFTVSSGMLEKINSDIEFGAAYSELRGFAEGFQTYQLLPEKENNYNFEISVNMNVDAANYGKSAYIFQKNLLTKAYECVKVMPVSEIGNVAFTTTQISDAIVLVQE